MDKKVYNTRVVPFVIYSKRIVNGREHTIAIENLTTEEIKNMSCEPRMLFETKEHTYMVEMSLTFHGGTSVKWSLYYVFDELTKVEQEKYFDRSIVIPTTIEKVVPMDGKSSKKYFGKKKKKTKI